MDTGLHEAEQSQQVEGSDYFPLFGACEATSGVGRPAPSLPWSRHRRETGGGLEQAVPPGLRELPWPRQGEGAGGVPARSEPPTW